MPSRLDKKQETVRVTMRLTDGMDKFIKQRAESREETPSQFLRSLIEREMKRINRSNRK